MEPRSERITWRTLLGFLALAVAIAAVAIPTAVWFDSSTRPVVIRFAVTLFTAVVLFRLVRVVREDARVDEKSQADLATVPRAVHVALDPLLLRLVSELRISVRWYVVPGALLERLRALSMQQIGRLPTELVPQPGRRPTWQDIERVVENLERPS
jgi:hypothetical protein